MTTTTVADILADMLDNGSDWEIRKTSVAGVFIQKMPATKTKPASLAVMVNPADDQGEPTKRRGLYLRTNGDTNVYKTIFASPKISKVVGLVAVANGGSEEDETEAGVLEI